MKSIIKTLLCVFLLGFGVEAMAQMPSNKIDKEVKKAAKDYTKDKWTVAPGALPLARQLERSYKVEYETDAKFNPKYVTGQGQSQGEVWDAARMTAQAMSKAELANKISSQITGLVEAQLKNQEFPNDQAASVVQVCEEFKSICEQKLGPVITLMELQRTTKAGTKEVLIRTAYNIGEGLKIGKNFIDSECKKKGIPYVMTIEQ